MAGQASNPATAAVLVRRSARTDDFAVTEAGTPVTVMVRANDISYDSPDQLFAGASIVYPPPPPLFVTHDPAHGVATTDPFTNGITYTPATGFVGTDSFRYAITDLDGALSDEATVTVVVKRPAGAVTRPTAADDVVGTGAGVPAVIDVLANDAAAGANLSPASVAVTQGPSHGSTSINPATGAITYVPAPGFAGTDSFRYAVADGSGAASNEAVVTVVVIRPLARDDFALALDTQDTAIPVTANDGNPGSLTTGLDPKGVRVVDAPAHGSVSVDPASGAVIYKAAGGFRGFDAFHYTVSGVGHAVSNEARVTVLVGSGHLYGHVFRDPNASGYQTTSPSRQSGAVVFLDLNRDGVREDNEPATVTDGNGAYRAAVSPLAPVVPVPKTYQDGTHSADDLLVRNVYLNVLGREADANGLAYWLPQLQRDGAAAVADRIWVSAEHRDQQVAFYYRTFFGRPADAGGKNFWLSYFAAGVSESDVARGFVTSSEYRASHGVGADYVRSLYNRLSQPTRLGGRGGFVGERLRQRRRRPRRRRPRLGGGGAPGRGRLLRRLPAPGGRPRRRRLLDARAARHPVGRGGRRRDALLRRIPDLVSPAGRRLQPLVPKLCLGTGVAKLRFAKTRREAELPDRRSQAELGDEENMARSCTGEATGSSTLLMAAHLRYCQEIRPNGDHSSRTSRTRTRWPPPNGGHPAGSIAFRSHTSSFPGSGTLVRA